MRNINEYLNDNINEGLFSFLSKAFKKFWNYLTGDDDYMSLKDRRRYLSRYYWGSYNDEDENDINDAWDETKKYANSIKKLIAPHLKDLTGNTPNHKIGLKIVPDNREQLCIIVDMALKEYEIYDLNFIDTKKVDSFTHLFVDDKETTKIDISYWKVTRVKTVKYMFINCTELKEIGDISDWPNDLEGLDHISKNCPNLKIDI